MKTISQIKDCQAIDLGYNSFRDLYLNPKQDMALDHLNICIARSMAEWANQKLDKVKMELLKSNLNNDFDVIETIHKFKDEIE